MGLDGSKGEKIRAAIEQFGKNLKRDIATSSPFDKTKNGFVTKVTPIGYTVRIENKEYPNVQAIEGAIIRVGDVVVCQLPNNQMSQMYIIGKKVNSTSGTGGGGGGDLTDVTLNGISVVSNGVARLIADTTPTSDSSHLITSGGVYTALGNYVTLGTAQTISGEKTFTAEKTNANKYHITANDGNSANIYGDGLVLLATNGSNWGSGTNGQYVFSSTEFRPSAYRQNLQDLGSSSSPWRTGYFGTQVRITSTADVGGTTDSTARAPLLIGTPTGTHLEFDSNEIIAKGSANTVGELFIQTDGGRTTLGNTLNWTELDTKRADLKVKGQIYDYGSNCSRGVDAGTNYAGYFKLAEAVIPSWFRGPKARIEVTDCDGFQTATLVINGYLGGNGVSNSSQITLETSNALGTWQNRFFLVVRQDKTVRDANKVFELWYYTPSGTTYSRVFASFRYDVADIRAGDPVVSKWNKFTRTSSVDQGYVSAGAVDLTNGFIPVGSFTASTFATTTYPDCEIYNDTVALQDRLSYLQIRNEESTYSDTPSTATSRVIDFIGKDFVRIADINTTVGESWNALNFDIKTKKNATHRIEFVSYPSTDSLHFSCQTDAKCNLGASTRRWKDLNIAGSLNDGTNTATATNIIKSVCVCETAAATAAKVVTIPDYTLRSGSMISIYFINTNTAAQPTLKINKTDAKPIYFDNSRDIATTALTAGWHTFIYNGTNYYTGNYLSDGISAEFAYTSAQIRQNVNILAGESITANRLIGARDDNKYYMLGAGKQISTLQPILFANSAISANVAGNDNWLIRHHTAAVMFNNGSSLTVTPYAPVFLVGTLNGHIFTTNSGTWWTQTIPTTEDGFQYMLIGYAYSTTQVRLFPEHPIYEYVGGAFRQNNIIPSDFLTQSNISTTYPISSSAASDTKVLSEKAVYNQLTRYADLGTSWTQIKQSGQAFTTSLRLYAGTYEFMVIAPSYSASGYAMQYGTMTIPSFNIIYDILSTGFYLYHSTAGAYDIYICRETDGYLRLQDKYGTDNNGQPVSVWYRKIQ